MRGFAAAQARYEAMMPPEGPDQIECEDCGGEGGAGWTVLWDTGHACGDLPGSYATEADYEYEAQDASDRCGGCGGTGMVDPPEPDGEPDDYDDRDDYDDTCDDYEGP